MQEDIQWHPPFRGAVKIELEPYNDILEYVDEIKFHDITISFVSSKIPHSVSSHLAEDRGYSKSNEEPGIYYFNKDKEIPIQFIDISELDAGHKWLVALTNQITEEMLHNIAVDYTTAGKNEYKDVILETVIKANYELIKQLKEEKAMTMSKEIKELFRPEIEAARNEGMQVAIKDMVVELHQMGLSIAQILQATKLSEDEIYKILNEV